MRLAPRIKPVPLALNSGVTAMNRIQSLRITPQSSPIPAPDKVILKLSRRCTCIVPLPDEGLGRRSRFVNGLGEGCSPGTPVRNGTQTNLDIV